MSFHYPKGTEFVHHKYGKVSFEKSHRTDWRIGLFKLIDAKYLSLIRSIDVSIKQDSEQYRWLKFGDLEGVLSSMYQAPLTAILSKPQLSLF